MEQTKEQGEVSMQLDRIENKFDELRKACDELEERFSIALAPTESTSTCDALPEKAVHCALARVLGLFDDKLSNLALRVRVIIGRCQL